MVLMVPVVPGPGKRWLYFATRMGVAGKPKSLASESQRPRHGGLEPRRKGPFVFSVSPSLRGEAFDFDFGFLRNRISRDEAVAGFDSVAKQRPDRVDAVSPADFLSFFGGRGIVGEGDFLYFFPDGAHFGRDLGAKLKPPALQTDTAEG